KAKAEAKKEEAPEIKAESAEVPASKREETPVAQELKAPEVSKAPPAEPAAKAVEKPAEKPPVAVPKDLPPTVPPARPAVVKPLARESTLRSPEPVTTSRTVERTGPPGATSPVSTGPSRPIASSLPARLTPAAQGPNVFSKKPASAAGTETIRQHI